MYSYSKLSTYNQCPRKYKFNYIDKIKVDDLTCLIKGRKLHKELENINKDNFEHSSPLIKSFLNNNLDIKEQLFNKNIKKEFRFGLDKNFKPCKYSSKAFYGGIIDLIYIDNILTLVDYKTGNYKDAKYQDFYQLMSYSLFFFNHQNINKIKLRYCYIEHNLENNLIISKQSTNSTKEWIVNTVNNIEHDKNFECKYSVLCNYCQFKNFCKK